MKKLIVLAVLMIFCCQYTFAQKLRKEYQESIVSFIESVANNRIEKIANLISYPLKREYPIPEIKNGHEFIARYDEFFDDSLKTMIINSNPSSDWYEMGWRGIMLNQGEVWIDYDGHITGINYQSKTEEKIKDKIIEAEKKTLHSSVSRFYRPVHILETKKFKIRIDDLGSGNYRYVSWPISKSMSEKPDLIIEKGEWIPDGSGGNHSYVFKNGEYTYECAIVVMSEENSSPATITIYKGDNEILSQDASIL